MNRRFTAIAAIALAAGALTACGSSDEEAPPTTPATTTSATNGPSESFEPSSPSASPAPSTAPAPTTSPGTPAGATTDAPPFTADTTTDTEQPSADAQLVLVDIRSGLHEGFDRVVLEFDGPGAAGWIAEYTLSASRQGSGQPIELDGGILLDIAVQGTAYPESGEDVPSAGEIPLAGTEVIKGLFNDGTFEGLTHVVLGIDQERPFRVFGMADPPRVVIDVQH